MWVEILVLTTRAVMITGFVFVLMLLIESINVQTQGLWQKKLAASRWKQYLLASFLGAVPGCLGAFTVVTLFSHRMLSFGALVAAMIATSGDEAFVMFAMFPEKAVVLTLLLFLFGIFAGFLTDRFYKPVKIYQQISNNSFPLHEETQCRCFQKKNFLRQIFRPSASRLLLAIIVLSLFVAVSTGFLAGNAKLWVKISLLLTMGFSLFIVVSVPDHFLEKHLWGHIVKIHIPRVFIWTFGTLLVFGILTQYFDFESILTHNIPLVLLMAVLIGIVPESGPHLVFVTLFAEGLIPFSVLLASSVSQDGHGTLPLLAESKRGFVTLKMVNIIFALAIGYAFYFAGI